MTYTYSRKELKKLKASDSKGDKGGIFKPSSKNNFSAFIVYKQGLK